MKFRLSCVALATLLFLAACGGSPTGPDDQPTPQPGPTPPLYIFLQPIFGEEKPRRDGYPGMSGNLVVFKSPMMLEARLDWTPTDAVVELYITKTPKGAEWLTCPSSSEPCQGYLAADIDPAKRPKKAVTFRLEPGEYAVWVRNRSSVTVTLTGEIGYYYAN